MYLNQRKIILPMNRSCISRPGKTRGVGMPQEYELAQFTRSMLNLHNSWNTSTTACSWSGVKCDKDERIIKIKWFERRISGEARWEYLPSYLNDLDVSSNQLEGSLDLTCLPSGLDRFDVSANMLSGSVTLHALPPLLKMIDLSDNRFSSDIDLTNLPPELYFFGISNNRCTGSLNFDSIPEKLDFLYLDGNDFDTEIDFSRFPTTLNGLFIQNNPKVRGVVSESVISSLKQYDWKGTEILEK